MNTEKPSLAMVEAPPHPVRAPEGDRLQRFMSKLSDALRPLDGPHAVRAEAARQLGLELAVDRALYAEVDEEGDVFFAVDYCGEGATTMAGRHRLDDFGIAAAGALRAACTVVIADLEHWEKLSGAEKQHCRRFDLRALLEVPLVKNGRLLGFLALHQSRPREWTSAEVALATEAAERTWVVAQCSKAETTLRISEEKYRSLFDAIDEGFCIAEVTCGEDGRATGMHYCEVNPAFERHTGLSGVVGKSVHELFPNLEPYWLDAATRVVQTGRPERAENFQADLGRWYSVRYSRIGGKGSRLLGIVFDDVTERKRVELTTGRLAALVETSDDAIIRKDLDGIIQTWNMGAQRMFGYAAEEVIGKSVTILIPPDRFNEEPGILQRIRRGERVDHYETVRQRKDGSLVDVSLTISPILGSDGKVIAASKIARDITERKRAETMLRESEERQGFLLMVSDAMREQQDGWAIGEVCTRMLAAHMEVDRCYITQMSRGQNRAWLGPEYHRSDLPSIFGGANDMALSDFPDVVRHLETETVVQTGVPTDSDLAAAGNVAVASIHMPAFIVAPLHEGETNLTWALVVGSVSARIWSREEVRLVEDVAERAWASIERRRVENALRESEMRLQKANHVKDEFIAMLSHELRNPLAPIATTLQLMKLRAPDVLTRERSIIEDQVRHLTGLVNDLLDVARITNGKVELNNERVDIQRIIAAAVETVQTTLEEHRQSLHVSAEDGLIVSGDHRRLVQVLINLLDNAAKYSPPDRNIWLSAKAEAGQVVLRVRDEGRGIATDLLPRIFESFIQDPQSLDRSRGGLGLGLAIVHNLVTLHDGSISASSDGPYKGSEFVVRLPLLERVQTPGAAAVEMQPEEGAFLRKDAERIKVLIVDDYAPAAESLALLLQEMGYHTHVVHDGAAALQAMGQFEPQLALVDIGLPVIDGYEVAQTVRRTPGRENLPLIAITGYGQASDHVRVMEAGFDEHVVKPLDAAHVSELIEKMVTAG